MSCSSKRQRICQSPSKKASCSRFFIPFVTYSISNVSTERNPGQTYTSLQTQTARPLRVNADAAYPQNPYPCLLQGHRGSLRPHNKSSPALRRKRRAVCFGSDQCLLQKLLPPGRNFFRQFIEIDPTFSLLLHRLCEGLLLVQQLLQLHIIASSGGNFHFKRFLSCGQSFNLCVDSLKFPLFLIGKARTCVGSRCPRRSFRLFLFFGHRRIRAALLLILGKPADIFAGFSALAHLNYAFSEFIQEIAVM